MAQTSEENDSYSYGLRRTFPKNIRLSLCTKNTSIYISIHHNKTVYNGRIIYFDSMTVTSYNGHETSCILFLTRSKNITMEKDKDWLSVEDIATELDMS